MKHINDKTIELIKRFEGCRLRAYRDAGGVWTIGYGHTDHAGEPSVAPGMRISKMRAVDILRSDVEKFAAGVHALLKRELNDNQFGALVSFSYNVGLGAFGRSSVLRMVNAGRFNDVPARLMLWTKAGGRRLRGLARRRRAEGKLFMTPASKRIKRRQKPPPDMVADKSSVKPALRPVFLWAGLFRRLMFVLSGLWRQA